MKTLFVMILRISRRVINVMMGFLLIIRNVLMMILIMIVVVVVKVY